MLTCVHENYPRALYSPRSLLLTLSRWAASFVDHVVLTQALDSRCVSRPFKVKRNDLPSIGSREGLVPACDIGSHLMRMRGPEIRTPKGQHSDAPVFLLATPLAVSMTTIYSVCQRWSALRCGEINGQCTPGVSLK